MKLNKSLPFGTVHGAHGGAVAYQNGHYFDIDDNYLFSDPGVAPPAGVKSKLANPAKASDPAAPAEQESGEASAPIGTVVPEDMTKEQMLNQLTVAQLKTLVSKAGGEPVLGSGAKAKMVAWLVDNTQ